MTFTAVREQESSAESNESIEVLWQIRNRLHYSLGKEFVRSSIGGPNQPRAAILEQAVAGVRAMDVLPDQNRFLSYADYN